MPEPQPDPRRSPTPGATTPSLTGDSATGAADAAAAEAIRSSPEFTALRASFRRFIFPMAGIFLAWYALYVLLAAFAPAFMSQRIGGSTITVGLLFGLGQFVSTFAITMIYRSWADRKFDPSAAQLRERIEAGAVR